MSTTVPPIVASVPATEAKTSDEQILRVAQDDTGAATPPAEEPTSGQAGVPVPQEEAVAEGAARPPEEKPAQEITEPGALKEVFKAHPELRGSYYAEKAYREVFPTVAEAREIKEVFATVEEAKQAQADAQLAATFDESYRSDPRGFLESLHESDSEAFQALVREFPQFLYSVSPESFRAGRQRDLEEVLTNTREIALQQGDENLKNAADVLAMALWGRTLGQAAPGRTDPRLAEVERREQALAQKEQEHRQGTFQAFYEATNAAYVEQAIGEIEQQVKSLLPSASPAAIQRIVRESWEALDGNLKANRALVADVRARLQGIAKSGKGSAEAQQELVELLAKRARGVMPAIIKGIVSQWTRDVLSANQQQLAKQREAAARKDIGAGGGGAVPSKPALKPGRRMTDKQLMDLVP